MALRWLLLTLLFCGGLAAAFSANNMGQHALGEQIRLCTIVVCIILFGCLSRLYPQAGLAVVGTLIIKPDELLLHRENRPLQCFSLVHAPPRIVIRYKGYQGEQVGRISFNGYENFISLNNSPQLRFWVPDESVTFDLQTIIRSWYLRKILVKEYCQDSRTFLLERNLSYEQIQAYKKAFGVSLY